MNKKPIPIEQPPVPSSPPVLGSGEAAELRRRAEAQQRQNLDPETLPQTEADIKRLFHELSVHQIELEMQNEELRAAQADLDAARERYFDLYDLAPVGYFTLNEKGVMMEANFTAAGLLGVARGEIINQPISSFILMEDQDIFSRHCEQLFKTHKPQHCDVRILKRDGTVFWARLSATAAQDAGGAPVFYATLVDISEHKQAEEEIKTVNQRLKLAQKVSKAGTWDWDIVNNQFFWSDEFLNIFGMHPNTIPGFDAWSKSIHPDDVQMASERIQEAIDKRTELLNDYRIVLPSHEIRWIRAIGNTLYKEDKPVRMLGLCLDITEYKQAEEALQVGESRHRAILQTTMDGYWRVDMLGHLLEVNEAYCQMTGYSEQELLAMSIPDLEAIEMPADTAAHIQQLLAKGEDRFETRHRRKDGSVFSIEISVQYKPAEGGYLVVFLRDITDRKRTESKMHEQLEELQRWYNVTLGREDRILELKHEVNNLLEESGRPPRYASVQQVKHE
jgi:PAS domain S-box-containing protein